MMSVRVFNDMLVEEEIRRVDPELVPGELSTMVERDMKIWALKRGLVHESHKDNIILHAIDRGWLQANHTGMEIMNDNS